MTQDLAARFRRFGSVEMADRCPLYAELSLKIAEDSDLLRLAGHTQNGQPAPNTLFGAVRYLLQESPQTTLATAFRSGEPAEDVFPLFRIFCLDHASEICGILEMRRTQTNEVARCALWLPVLSMVCARAERPIVLAEIGASAGLNLQFDHYRYDYGRGVELGYPDSQVALRCDVRGETLPRLRMPMLAGRFGIDLNPLDPKSEDDRRWLVALILPGKPDRERRLIAALRLASAEPYPVETGDALARLPDMLAKIDAHLAVCVLHSFVLYQFTPEQRARLEATLHDLAKRRPVTRIALESNIAADADLKLHTYAADGRRSRTLATADPHGRWLRWTG